MSSLPPASAGECQGAVPGCGLVCIPSHSMSAECPLVDEWADGVAIQTLDPGTSLTVRTRYSEYRLTVVDGERREVLVQGGRPFPETTHACFEGSTAGGGALKIGSLAVGLRMELSVGRKAISTSPVQSITIEPPHGSGEAAAAS